MHPQATQRGIWNHYSADVIEHRSTTRCDAPIEHDHLPRESFEIREHFATVKEKLFKLGTPEARRLGIGIVLANAAVHSGAMFATFLYSSPRRSSTLLRFMYKNFVLSRGWLQRGHIHGFFTSIFSHVNAVHLVSNSALTWFAVQLCSDFLSAWETAGLFLGGGVLGGVASVSIAALLKKACYQEAYMGGSGGLLALLFFYSNTENHLTVLSHDVDLREAATGAIFVEVMGVLVYLRRGYRSDGVW